MSNEMSRSTTITDGGESSPPEPTATPGDKAAAAKEESAVVAQTAKEAGKDVAGEVQYQASTVAADAKNQIQRLVHQAKDEVRSQSEVRGQQLATRLQSFSSQLQALGDGRPQDAGELQNWVRDAQQRVQSYATSLQERGPNGLLQDVSRFARRRPGLFLFAAGVTGFAIGRIVRSGGLSSDGQGGPEQEWHGNGQPYSTGLQPGTTAQRPLQYGTVGAGLVEEDLPAPSPADRWDTP